MSYERSTLHKHLLADLAAQPTPYNLHLTVLSSQPKRTTSLFPYSPNHGRCYQQEYLVTLSAELKPVGTSQSIPTADAAPEGSTTVSTHSQDTTKRILLSAISANLYTFPTSSTSILYISKVDSSSYHPQPNAQWSSSPTRQLIISFITYFLHPSTRPTERVRCQLFARSQNQYLFANSVESGQKKVLGGLGLCGWWKGVYESVAERLVPTQSNGNGEGSSTKSKDDIHLAYLLPSYSAAEALGMLRPSRKPLPEPLAWKYEPPFTTPIISNGHESLANLIPSLPDDPKTRFLEELVNETVRPPTIDRLPSKVTTSTSEIDPEGTTKPSNGVGSPERGIRASRKRDEAASEDADRKLSHSILSRTKPDEFWERMGFRQECASGDVTGFFTLAIGTGSSKLSSVDDTFHGPAIGNDKDEFQKSKTSTAETRAHQLPLAIIERLLKALLNLDFKSRDFAIESSAIWDKTVKSIASDEIGMEAYERECVGVAPGREGLEEVQKRPREEVQVTMLQPRKKKK